MHTGSSSEEIKIEIENDLVRVFNSDFCSVSANQTASKILNSVSLTVRKCFKGKVCVSSDFASSNL